KEIADHLAQITFQQILIDGFFHADPHPGNILIQPNNELVLLDFGMVGRLTNEMREQFGLLLLSMMNEDIEGIVEHLLDMGIAPSKIDKRKLTADVGLLMDKYYHAKLSEIQLADAIRELFQIAHKHKIRLSSEYSTLAKTILTLEGAIAQLDPDLSIVEVAKTYGQRLLRERYRPRKIVKQITGHLSEYSDL